MLDFAPLSEVPLSEAAPAAGAAAQPGGTVCGAFSCTPAVSGTFSCAPAVSGTFSCTPAVSGTFGVEVC